MVSMVMAMRGLLTCREVAVVAGEGQEGLRMIERQSNARLAISDKVDGMEDRVVTVAGGFSEMASVFMTIGFKLAIDSRTRVLPVLGTGACRLLSLDATFVRLLVANGLVGTIIGRDGLTISHIQGNSGARVVALKDMLMFSNERIVEVQGSVQQIRCAVEAIARQLVASWDKSLTTKHYLPCPTLRNNAIEDWLEPRENQRYPGHEAPRLPNHAILSCPLSIPLAWTSNFFTFASQLDLLVKEHEQLDFQLDEYQPDPNYLNITITGYPAAAIRVHNHLSEKIDYF
ncbi:RNA binding protein, heterogenous nuclear RNP-K like protein [Massospora cicadina]|nr:RNA binding protein, heterogenous nuclear RNP-K like protein [Massospora cicadina]